MTAAAPPSDRTDGRGGLPDGTSGGPARPLVITGALAACAAAGTGLVLILLLVLAGWIAAPHAGVGLPGVMRTAADLWLVSHHVGFALHGTGRAAVARIGAGRIGMLPLGLVLLPGALLWLAGRWVVRKGEVSRLPEVGYAALALAVPYALLAGGLALAGQSALATPSPPQAVLAGFLLALVAGGLGGARALAPWHRLVHLLPPRSRSVSLGAAGALAVATVAGAILAGASLGTSMTGFRAAEAALAPGAVGGVLLLLIRSATSPTPSSGRSATPWARASRSAPGRWWRRPGPRSDRSRCCPCSRPCRPGRTRPCRAGPSLAVLSVPYLAGVFGGLITARAAPTLALELALLRGLPAGWLPPARLACWPPFPAGRSAAAASWWSGRPGGRRPGWPRWRWGSRRRSPQAG